MDQKEITPDQETDLFYYWNPHTNNIDLTLPQPIGTVRVGPRGSGHEFIPTPHHKEDGVTAKMLRDFEGPSFLSPTPPEVRRSLLEKAGKGVPSWMADRTRHLPQFQVDAGVLAQAATAAAGAPLTPRAGSLDGATRASVDGSAKVGAVKGTEGPSSGQSMAESLQVIADARCSGRSVKKG